jgi:hypothetical protein
MTGTLPRVGALDQLRATGRKVGAAPRRAGGAVGRAAKSVVAPFGRMAQRVRENPRIAVATACGVLLLLAWIGWAIYVANENGASAGLGVMIAWPAMVAALALISLPFIGGYMLIRSPSIDEGNPVSAAESTDPEAADHGKAEVESEENSGGEHGDEGAEAKDEEGEGDEDHEEANPEGEDDSRGDEDVEPEEPAAG